MAVISKKPVKKGPGLPPILGGTPNPLANVNPSPAQNRNTAFPKTGAILPFPDPNQPQIDLATPPGGVPLSVQPVVGGVTAGLTTAGGLPPVITGGQDKGGVTVQPGAASTQETPEQELARLQREYSALALIGESDPNYRPTAGLAVRLQVLEAQITSLFSRIQSGGGTLPDVDRKAAEERQRLLDEEAERKREVTEIDPDLKALLDRHLLSGGEISPQLLNQLLLGFESKGKSISPNELRRQAQAYIDSRPAQLDKQRIVDKTEAAEDLTKLVKDLGLDAYGVTPAEFAKYGPDQLYQLYNLPDSKMTEAQLRGALEGWQARNGGQKMPIPAAGSKAYQLYQTLKTLGKADALFVTALPGSAGAVTPQQVSDYMGRLAGYEKLPQTADEAYAWLQQPLEAPPGLVHTTEGWANADGSPPTPEQQAALNRYISRLNTQDADREKAYGLISARDGAAAAQKAREQQRASGATPVFADATMNYRQQLKGFSRVPTTLAEATAWLAQTLTPPPGLTFDETTKQWVDERGKLPTFDRAQAVQDYEFQQSQYAKNREKADGIIKSYADIDAAQRGASAAEAALQKALGTKDVLEQVELTYLKSKADLAFTQAQTKHQQTLVFVELTNNPAMAARLKALGLLDKFNQDTGLNITVPDRVDKSKLINMIPSLGDWANMNPQQQMDALEMLSARTGWMPEELAALMSETAGAPGGGRGGGVSESTTKRS